jgi:hypothetical protein
MFENTGHPKNIFGQYRYREVGMRKMLNSLTARCRKAFSHFVLSGMGELYRLKKGEKNEKA